MSSEKKHKRRAIKFRAWHPTHFDDDDNEVYEMVYDLAFEDYEPINDLLNGIDFLMQYTGIDDVNGRNIYEGDIVKDTEGDMYCVQWLDGKGLFFLASLEDSEYDCTMTQVMAEVIGNIYENPELAEVEETAVSVGGETWN